MINGLTVALSTRQLRALCRKRIEYLEEKIKWADESLESKKDSPAIDNVNNNSKKDILRKKALYIQTIQEIRFVSEHLIERQTYILSVVDLQELGIVGEQSWR